MYVNGARFNTPFGDLAMWSLLPNDAIQSLNLEDGNPVFGLNALGGAISVQMKNGFTAHGGEASISGGSFGQIQGNLQYGKQVGNVAAYVDVGALHEAGWRDLQSSDLQNFFGDLGWKGPHTTLHINATLANSTLAGPGTVPVQILAADPAAQFTGPNSIADKYAKLSATLDARSARTIRCKPWSITITCGRTSSTATAPTTCLARSDSDPFCARAGRGQCEHDARRRADPEFPAQCGCLRLITAIPSST